MFGMVLALALGDRDCLFVHVREVAPILAVAVVALALALWLWLWLLLSPCRLVATWLCDGLTLALALALALTLALALLALLALVLAWALLLWLSVMRLCHVV